MNQSILETWRVLVIDDEPDSIEVVEMVLSAAGATVLMASNGKDGLQMFRQQQPTIVLTDLSMPEMDGWQLLREIRAQSERFTPVIALTAHAMAGDRERVLAAGFNGYLSKPLKMFTLIEDLQSCLRNGGPNSS